MRPKNLGLQFVSLSQIFGGSLFLCQLILQWMVHFKAGGKHSPIRHWVNQTCVGLD